jgi:hypothetical protein
MVDGNYNDACIGCEDVEWTLGGHMVPTSSRPVRTSKGRILNFLQTFFWGGNKLPPNLTTS